MSASGKEFQRGIAMMKAAMPEGPSFPRNEDEWSKAVTALQQLGYAVNLEAGMPEAEARTLAHITHGGATGRLLLAIAKRREAV